MVWEYGKIQVCTDNDSGETIDIFLADSAQQTDPLSGYSCVNKDLDVLAGDEGNLQGVFFDGAQDDAQDFPDLVRIMDTELRNEPVGVLKSISEDDMRNTDILFFREATGQLILERRGLKQEEAKYRRAVQYDSEENEVAYRVMLRGRNDSRLNVGGGVRRSQSYDEWATEYQLTEPFRTRNSDQPRPGEYIKIVAINRATGYTGTARVQLKSAGDNGTGLLNVNVPNISLTPPNLKIWAERNYEVQQGLTKGEDRTYTIGNEGGSLTSDTTVTVYTEWLDEDGKPLPAGLGAADGGEYGLTARIAKVVAPNTLQGTTFGNDLSEFSIEPGRHTQVVRIKDNFTSPEHFYIHVIGQARYVPCTQFANCPTFSSTGDQAPYDSRPNLLTPFLTPLADEDKSWQEYNEYRRLKGELGQADPSDPNQPNVEKPLPAYVWQYRPEYQFSQFDLEINEINRQLTDESGNVSNINILDIDRPAIGSSDDLITALYSLISSQFERLTPIDGEQQLILAIGETEQLIKIGADQTIAFDDLSSLGSLDSDDFLSMRLYLNNDASNILWEYAFEYVNFYALLDDDILPADDGAIEISADEPEVGLVANVIGFANRDQDKKYNISINWKLDGDGALETDRDSDDDVAIFRNTLTLAREAGSVSTVSAQLVDTTSGQEQDIPLIFRVVPGAPAVIEAVAEGALTVDGGQELMVRGTAKDRWGNSVVDGTSVTVTTSNSVELDLRPESTENGEFSFSLKGTDFAEEGQVDIIVGNASKTVDIEVKKVDIEITGLPSQTNIGAKHLVVFNASVDGEPLANYTMDVWAENGRLSTDTITTGPDGSATAGFFAPPEPDQVTVKAMAGLQAPTEQTVEVVFPTDQPLPQVNTFRAKLIGDADTAEVLNFQRWDTTNFTVTKQVQSLIQVRGAVGETVPVTLGDIYEPNHLMQAAYWMNSASDGQLFDEVGFSRGLLENVVAVNDSMEQADSSLYFAQALDSDNTLQPSRAYVSNASRFQFDDNVSFRINVKAEEYGGELVNLGNGLVLELSSSGVLQLKANTSQGEFTLEHLGFPLNEWQKIAVAYQDQTLTLAVGDEPTTPALQNCCKTAAKLLQNCCKTAAKLLQNCCKTAAKLLQNCCKTAAKLGSGLAFCLIVP